jgi:hypothetical protein
MEILLIVFAALAGIAAFLMFLFSGKKPPEGFPFQPGD